MIRVHLYWGIDDLDPLVLSKMQRNSRISQLYTKTWCRARTKWRWVDVYLASQVKDMEEEEDESRETNQINYKYNAIRNAV